MKVIVIKFDGKTCVEFVCPGCGDRHSLPVRPHTNGADAGWQFNGNENSPTLSPSILSKCGPILNPEHRVEQRGWNRDGMKICHSSVTDGKIQFLGDCTHNLANTTVELPEITE